MISILLRSLYAVLFFVFVLVYPAISYSEETDVVLPTVRVKGERPKETMSATKTNATILDLPQSVTIISRAMLDSQNPQTVKAALNYTAGVLSSVDSTSRYDSLFMRGFGGFGTSTNIVDFLDGLRLPRGQGFAIPAIDPFLLERIDVLKGPSAVLYGQTSPGGLVNQVSRMPQAKFNNEAWLEGSTYERIQGGATSQGAFSSTGTWQYSISAIGRHSGTRYDGVKEERVAVSPAVKWEPTSNTHLLLRAFYQHDPQGGYFNSIYPRFLAPDAYRSYLDSDLNVGDPGFDSYNREQKGISYDFRHRFNNVLSVRSKARYTTMDLGLKSLQMAAPMTPGGLLPRRAAQSMETVEGVAMDNHVQLDFSTGFFRHKALLGLDVQHSMSTWEYKFGSAPSLDVTNPQYGVPIGALATIIDNTQTLQQTGIYVQDQVSLGGFRGLFGTRYDWTEQDTKNRLIRSTNHQESGIHSYRIGVLYLFDAGFAPYASYSTSFEPTVGGDSGGNPFKPTEAEQWEIGLKYEPNFMDAVFTASAFHIRQENVLTAGPTIGFYVQGGEIRSRGFELEAYGNITKNLEVTGSVTFLDTEVTKSTVSSSVGKRPQAAPSYYGSIWGNYSVTDGILEGLTLGGGVRIVGSSFADDANTLAVDGYTVADAMIRYNLAGLAPELGNAELTLHVTNLFDKEYYSSGSYNFYYQYGNGRQALLGLRYKW